MRTLLLSIITACIFVSLPNLAFSAGMGSTMYGNMQKQILQPVSIQGSTALAQNIYFDKDKETNDMPRWKKVVFTICFGIPFCILAFGFSTIAAIFYRYTDEWGREKVDWKRLYFSSLGKILILWSAIGFIIILIIEKIFG